MKWKGEKFVISGKINRWEGRERGKEEEGRRGEGKMWRFKKMKENVRNMGGELWEKQIG